MPEQQSSVKADVAGAPSLRSIITRSIIVLTLVALFSGISLVYVADSFNRVSQSLSRSTQSTHLSEEAAVHLLVHARLADPMARAQSELAVRSNMKSVAGFTDSPAEAKVLEAATKAVDEYFDATHESSVADARTASLLERAFRELEHLSEINVEQSQLARQQAHRLGRSADTITFVTALVVLVVVPLVLWWLNARAFRPSTALSHAMTDFAGGRWEARAPESGPAELRKMAAQFNEMAARLAQQRKSQAAMLAGVAHDLRTPISALKMSAEAIPEDQPLPSESGIRKVVGVVRRQATQLERMVEDLLNTTRIEAGDLTLSMSRHDLRELVRNVVDLFATASNSHPIALRVPDDPVWASCDGGRVEQVLTNVLSNAIKYSPDGGEVEVRIQPGSDRSSILVSDQGVGIAPEEQERLFEPFYRAGRTDRPVKGTGLGLVVARRLVEAHGGRINVQSTVGRGTTVTVWLPSVEE